MDLADALGSNQPLERRWEIMKDPQIGSFGMLALLFLLAWKGVLLWALLQYHAPLWTRPGLELAAVAQPPRCWASAGAAATAGVGMARDGAMAGRSRVLVSADACGTAASI